MYPVFLYVEGIWAGRQIQDYLPHRQFPHHITASNMHLNKGEDPALRLIKPRYPSRHGYLGAPTKCVNVGYPGTAGPLPVLPLSERNGNSTFDVAAVASCVQRSMN